jgi:ribonuclease BN (tRNA processing enzyme)
MRLIVLGCSGSGPGPGSPASGYLVETGHARLVLDLGNGTLGALQRHVDPWELDAVAFSHLHPDHCADFASLVVHRRYHPRPPYDAAARPLPVYAPAEAPDRFAAAYAPSAAERAETDLTDVFAFHALADGASASVGDATLTARRVDHLCEAYALRVDAGGRTSGPSGRTNPRPGCICPDGRRVSTPRRPGPAGCSSRMCRPGSPARSSWPRRRRRSRGRWSW